MSAQRQCVWLAPLTERHWAAVVDIYAAGIATGQATFETEPPTWEQFDATRLAEHRHVAVNANDTVLGWVAASPVSERCVYAGVVEDSVYVHPRAAGQGIGRLLLDALIASTEAAGIWTIQCGIFPENLPSLAVHRRAAFRDVGMRHRLGYMRYGSLAGQWRDVILLERRSGVAGTTSSPR
jgi:L-amino acid N-acyltransferase YncA